MNRLRPRPLDLLLALALASLVQLEVWETDVTVAKTIAVPAGLLMTLPLAWRRRAPLGVITVVMCVWLTESVLDDSPQSAQSTLLGILVAVYSVAAYSERPGALAGLGLGLAAAFVSEPGDMIVMGPFLAGVWLAGRLFRDRQWLAHGLQLRTDALEREHEETARLAIAEERARIARELHDVVAHSVTVMVVEAGAERMALGEGRESTREALLTIERTGRQALTEMRRLLGVLREDEDLALAPQPSLDHIDALAARMRGAGLPVDLEIQGRRSSLPPGVDISAYRIVQEALTNVLKHAGATRARVIVRYGQDELELEVVDDGRGSRTGDGGGHGLVGMRERVTIFGGVLRAGNEAGGGYGVRARLPIERARP